MKGILIPVEGDMKVVEYGDWRSMANLLGCEYVERVRIWDEHRDRYEGRVIAVNESGAWAGDRLVNERASVLYGTPWHHASIYGDALFVAEGYVGDGVDFVDFDPTEDFRVLCNRFGWPS